MLQTYYYISYACCLLVLIFFLLIFRTHIRVCHWCANKLVKLWSIKKDTQFLRCKLFIFIINFCTAIYIYFSSRRCLFVFVCTNGLGMKWNEVCGFIAAEKSYIFLHLKKRRKKNITRQRLTVHVWVWILREREKKTVYISYGAILTWGFNISWFECMWQFSRAI